MIKESFSYWMRYNLKDAYSGLITQDIDFVILDKERKVFLFLEEKNSRKARLGPAQKVIFDMFDKLFRFTQPLGYRFLGTHILYVYKHHTRQEIIREICRKIRRYTYKNYELPQEVIDKLWDCRGNPPIKKTERERSGYRDSLLQGIINPLNNEKRIVRKIDWIFLNYCSGYFIFLEERNRYRQGVEDRDVSFMSIIDSIFSEASRINERENFAQNPKSGAIYKYLGYYVLNFSNTNPDNSEITLNEVRVDKDTLKELLNLDKDKILEYRKFY
ncbi:hypothetical protein JCM9492_15550 [Aquifex pyrophilus]